MDYKCIVQLPIFIVTQSLTLHFIRSLFVDEELLVEAGETLVTP